MILVEELLVLPVIWTVPSSAMVLGLTVLLFADCSNLKSGNFCTTVCILLVLWNEIKVVWKRSVHLHFVPSFL